MARIGLTLSGIERSLLSRLAEADAAMTLSSLRMATGKRINAAGDDPGAFVALSQLQSQLSAVTSTTSNVTAAASMVGQTQDVLEQIRDQLDTIRTELLKDENHGLTPAQRTQSQETIDEAIEQINALSSTSINGRRTLDGSANYNIVGQNSYQVADVAVYSTGGATRTIAGRVTSPATQAELTYTGNAANQVTANATFSLTGNRGGIVVSVTAGQTLESVAETINNNSHKTGVTASVDLAEHELVFNTVDYGSSATIAIGVTSGSFAVSGGNGDGTANGTNAAAVLNDQIIYSSSSNVDGNRFTVAENSFRFSIEFKPDFAGEFDTITVSGSALTFALATDLARTVPLAIPGTQPARLGGPSGTLDQLRSGGPLAGLGNNTSQAIRVVDEALGVLTRVEGNVDGFYNAAIDSASGLLSDLQLQLQTAIEEIDGVDDAEEEQLQAHYQALADNAISGLTLIHQQRLALVEMIKSIAGLD